MGDTPGCVQDTRASLRQRKVWYPGAKSSLERGENQAAVSQSSLPHVSSKFPLGGGKEAFGDEKRAEAGSAGSWERRGFTACCPQGCVMPD